MPEYPTNDTSIFSFESLLRGFVPRDLSNTLALIHSKKVVSEIITETLSIAKQAFKQQVGRTTASNYKNLNKLATSLIKTNVTDGKHLPQG